jgi:glycine cleavage system H lipoate-binding protein
MRKFAKTHEWYEELGGGKIKIGTVVEVNSKLKDQAPLINQDPEGAGWIAIVQLDDPKALEGYLTEEQYLATLH